MTDPIMRCNDLQCRQELTDKAVVTTCSHIFCLRCAQSSGLFHQHRDQRACPACGTGLFKDDDCVAAALNPSEDYKSSVLCGLSPSIIMECATRALEFYSYQATNAVMYQEHLAQSLTTKYKHHTDQLQQQSHELTQELGQARDSIQDYRKSCDGLENKYRELSVAFKEKSKALAETQSKYQQIKTQAMLADVQYAASEDAENTMQAPKMYNATSRAGPLFRNTNSFLGDARHGYGTRHIPSVSSHARLPTNIGGIFDLHKPLHRRNDTGLSSHGSMDRSGNDHTVHLPQLPAMQRTRIPMPVGMSINPNLQRKVPSRAELHSQAGFNHPLPRNHNVGLSGSLKRGRMGRTQNLSYV